MDISLFFQGILIFPTLSFFLFLSLLLLSALSGGLELSHSDAHHGFLEDFAASLGLSKIPLIVGLATTFFFMTALCYFITIAGYPQFSSWLKTVTAPNTYPYFQLFIDLCITAITFIISLFSAGFALHPLEKHFFNLGHQTNYIGKNATVRYVFDDPHKARIIVLIDGHESTLKAFSEHETFEVGQTVTIMAKDAVLGSYLITKTTYNLSSFK